MTRNTIVLTEEQSDQIRRSGVRFAVLHPGSYPQHAGRWIIDLIACDDKAAMNACAVALGQARAVKNQKPKDSTPQV